MIPVSLDWLIFIYLGLTLALVFGTWLISEYRRQRRELLAFRHVLRCGICAFEFEDKSGAVLPRCPQCGSLNERFPLSRL
jgi:hypothetical protein